MIREAVSAGIIANFLHHLRMFSFHRIFYLWPSSKPWHLANRVPGLDSARCCDTLHLGHVMILSVLGSKTIQNAPKLMDSSWKIPSSDMALAATETELSSWVLKNCVVWEWWTFSRELSPHSDLPQHMSQHHIS